MSSDFEEQFRQNILASFEENLTWLKKATKDLTQEELWHKMNRNSNSIGVLCQHLSGNITQYIIAGLGNEADLRKRSLEFVNEAIFKDIKAFDLLSNTIDRAMSVIHNIKSEEFYKIYQVQGITMKGFEILQHVSQHLYYHSGQIVLLNKIIKNEDLDLYAGRDLNKLN